MRLQQAMDNHKDSVAVDDHGDLERGQKALEMFKPVISKKYGEKSDYAMVWGQMIAGMCRPIGMAPRYNSQALLFGIELAAQTKADVYDKVASLLNLPPRSHCKRVQRRIIYEKNGCYKSGFQRHTVSLFRNVAKEKGLLKHGPLLVCIAFDCMIMKKNIVLSTRTVDKGKMIGCVASNDLTTLENHFENYVHTVTNLARESGKTKFFDDTMTDPSFQHNKEHLVCYARCMAPGVDLTFIAGAWNLPSCRKIDLVAIVHDVMIGLYSFQFETRVITCDNAQCNEGFLKTMSSLKANCILPTTILDEYQLSGDMFVAMKHPVNAKPVIYISDPPHCLKRLAGAVRTRDLQYDGCPMTGKLLFDVWQAVQDSYGGDASLLAHRKYKYNDFIDGGGFASMNVASAARLFSATTRAMLDEVGQNPDKYTRLLSTIPKMVDRQKFFSKVSELVTLLNDFFDLCNGKEGSNVFVRFHVHNGEKYQRKFLEVIKWFGDWERSLNIVQGTKNELGRSHFIAAETYRSLKYVCYGHCGNAGVPQLLSYHA